MKLKIIIKQRNPNYDKDYVIQYGDGKLNDQRLRDNFSREFEFVHPIDDVQIIKDENIRINLNTSEKDIISLDLNNMSTLNIYIGDKKSLGCAISKNLIEKIHKVQNKKYNILRYYFYLKNDINFIPLTQELYVIHDDLPLNFRERYGFQLNDW